MAFGAVVRYGFVNIFGRMNGLGLVCVAHEAEGWPLSPQVFIIIRCVRVMAGNAAADSSGAMYEFISDKFLVMAFKT